MSVLIRDTIRRFLSDQGCGLYPISEILEERTLFDIGFDSLRYMELVVLIEEQLQFTVPDEMLEISFETTVGDVIDLVETGCGDCHARSDNEARGEFI